ncbi:head GIN domain-containing protein [Corallococcus sp. EGB]|uniref:head GIN domain-containing protein n=1 Tax=Corallococcus sp. EGB TaxID=1521117 RepID=UPI001CBA9382|nr:head GIN domain-containing protein [Corallococcus sp. EGB]
MRMPSLSLLAVCCLAATACTAHAAEATKPSASQDAGETRQVEDFHGVSVSHGMRAEVKVGPKSVRLEGSPENLSRIQLRVEDGILTTRVERKGWDGLNGRVRLIVSSPRIDHVEASGGARMDAEATASGEFGAEASGGAVVTVRGVDARKVDAEASGGSEITLNGRATRLDVEASGGSQVHAQKLQGLEQLEAEASGGSIVEADAPSKVSGDASGGSIIRLSKRPQSSNVDVSGGSRLDASN